MRIILLISMLLYFPNVIFSHPNIEVLTKNHKKTCKVSLRIFIKDMMLIGENCRLVITNKELKGKNKTYEQYIQSGDYIRIPKGIWDFRLYYKFGYSEYKATLILKKRKHQVKINIDSWIQMDGSGHLVGNLNIDEKINLGKTETFARRYLAERFDFFGLPVKGSFSEKDKSFLVNWLIDKPYSGRVWYATRLPFIINKNNSTDFNFEVLMKLDPSKVMSFYYHPSDNRLEDSFVVKNINEIFKSVFKNKQYYYPYLATSLVLDTLAGMKYTGLDIDISSDMDLEIWFCLLNLGYQIPAICTNVHGVKNNSKVFNFMQLKKSANIADKFEAIRNGELIMSTGPAMTVKIDNVISGGSLVANNSKHKLVIKLRTDPNEWDLIKSVEVIRNGKVIKSFYPKTDQNLFLAQLSPVFEEDYAWYVIRGKTKSGKIIISNPIYFLPLGYVKPKPLVAVIKIKAIDIKGVELVKSKITVMNGKKKILEKYTNEGSLDLYVPITATIKIEKSGYLSETIKVAKLLNLDVFLLKLSTVIDGGSSALANKKTYEEFKAKCQSSIYYAELKKIEE
ncbi:MAG: hypothetical protein COA79_13520 [Planctomycetota bacterium]|nr:MAG: hypothetical protein COA79_13520 [Planctomycetota bacterium]